MELQETAKYNFKLQPAAIDWTTQKTQVAIAAPVAALAFVTAAGFHAAAAVTALGALDCVLVALITAEVTGRFGNRLGTAPCMWAAVLYGVMAGKFTGVDAVGTGSLMHAASTALCLLAVFCYLRFRTTREQVVLASGLAAMCASLFTSLVAVVLPMTVLLSEGLLPKGKRRWMAVLLYFVVLAFTGTVGILSPNMVPMLHTHLPVVFDATNMKRLVEPGWWVLVPVAATGIAAGSVGVFAFCALWFAISYTDASLLAAPLSIVIATLALPCTRAVSKRTATIVTYVGLVAMTAFAFMQLQ